MAAARTTGPLGRDDVLGGLSRAIDDAIGGTGRVVLLAGEAGIGKTTLLAEGARLAADRGARVGWGWGWPGEGAPGYWPWIQVIRALGLDLPEAAGADSVGAEAAGSARFRFFDELTSLLLAESRIQPLVIILDDLQWADHSSLLLLDFLARRLPAGAAAVLGAYRGTVEPGPYPAALPLAQVISRSTVVPLAGLAGGAVAELITRVTGEQPGEPAAADMLRRTGGNPFFIEQMCWLIKAGGTGVPPGVREALAERFAALPEAAIATIGVAALAGHRVAAELVADVTGMSIEDTGAALDVCAKAGLLIADGSPGEFSFGHDLYREYAAGQVPPARHARLHELIGLALERRMAAGDDVTAAELAWHFVRADPGSRQAYSYSVQAARHATARLAFDEAAGHWSAALGAADPGSASVISTLLELADARLRAGAGSDAREAYLRAAALARQDGDVRNLARAALGLQAIGVRMWSPPEELIDVLAEALAELGSGTDGPDAGLAALRARVMASLARTLAWYGKQVSRARQFAADAVTIARAAQDRQALVFCLLAHHNVIWAPGTARERSVLAREAAALAEQIGDTELLAEARVLTVTDLLELADPAFRDELDAFLRLADASGQPRFRHSALVRRAMLALLGGRYTDAARLIDEAVLLGRECGEPQAADVWSDQSWDLLSGLGRRAELADYADAMFPDPDSKQARGVRALVLLAAGDPDGAVEAVAPLTTEDAAAMLRPGLRSQTGNGPVDEAGDIPLTRPAGRLLEAAFVVELITSLGRAGAFARPGRPDPSSIAEALYTGLAPFAGSAVISGAAISFRGVVDHHLGALAAFIGRDREAAAHLERAVALHQALGARPWELRSRLELGRLLAAGRIDAAGQADATGTACPAARDHALAELAEVSAAARKLGMAQLATEAAEAAEVVQPPAPAQAGEFRRHGAVWTIAFAGTTIRMRDAKGLGDLAVLLSAPGREFPAADLVAAAGACAAARSALRLGADEVLDETARRQIRGRLADLDEEISEAERWSDPERAARARVERDDLVTYLAAAAGLGGRSRLLGDQAERARKAVTARIRDSVRRIDAAHPVLGAHLRASVTTGTRCSYSPQTPVTWQL